jgi:glycosyltransferase involved in cell wall biosynthesis
MTPTGNEEKGIKKIGIVIPAFNEGKTIEKVVLGAIQYGTPIVVDDGSSDDTFEVAQRNGAAVVKHVINQGYDKALGSGFAKAKELGCSCIITLDADGQHDPDILKSYIHALDNGADIVLGIRDRKQRIAEKIFAIIAKAKFGIEDPLCGMKAYRIDIYNELGHFDSYNSIGTELAIFAARTKKNIVQIHFKTIDRADHPRFGKIVSANFRILRALWYSLFAN